MPNILNYPANTQWDDFPLIWVSKQTIRTLAYVSQVTLGSGNIRTSGWFEQKGEASDPPTQVDLEKIYSDFCLILGWSHISTFNKIVLSVYKINAQILLGLLS